MLLSSTLPAQRGAAAQGDVQIAQGGRHDGLDGVHAVLSLLELAAVVGVEHLVGNFHLLHAEALGHIGGVLGLRIMEGRQAVQEDVVRVLHMGQQLSVHLVGRHELHALSELRLLAHGRPHVRVDGVGILHRLHRVVRHRDGSAALGGEGPRHLDDGRVGLEFGRRGVHVVHAQDGAGDHEGVLHVVASLAAVGQREALQRAEVLLHGHEVGQHLGGMLLVGEAVPHRHAAVRAPA